MATARRRSPAAGSTTPTINPWAIAEGRAPEASGEVVIDQRAADDGDFAVGDTVTVLTPTPVERDDRRHRRRSASDDSLGGATFAAFTYEEAQQLFMPDPSKASSILVAADDRREPGPARRRPRRRAARRRRGDHRHRRSPTEDNEDINDDFLGFFETFLLVFAGIALLVATFSIYNTFSIIIAQRTRESALLRAIGASRRQVL